MKNRLILLLGIFISLQAAANNMLIQNVSTTGNNAAAKTIQVQFDLSWDNSWRDGINWDAAWIFIKFKDANGLWQHAQLNPTGFANGSGTANTMKVTSDKVGCWAYRSALGSGTFNATSMQLQWNYGLSGLNDVTGLEVRVFSTEMVYVPEGEFNCAKTFFSNGAQASFSAPGNNLPVINTRITPSLIINEGNPITIRVLSNVGIDTNNDGVVDNTTFPTGYSAFYAYKMELSEQQYADFLNTLTVSQISTLGIAGTGIYLSNGQYFASSPNKACGNSNSAKFLAFADWSGLRPMTLLEFNKMSYGPIQPVYVSQGFCYLAGLFGYPAFGGNSSAYNFEADLIDVGHFAINNDSRLSSGASYYGILDLTGNAHEPIVKSSNLNFGGTNGDGIILNDGLNNVSDWNSISINYIDMLRNWDCSTNGKYYNFLYLSSKHGFRFVRSAE